MRSQSEILRAIWLAAFRTGEKRIYYETKIEAKRMQMHLYGVYKPLRKNPAKDPELFEAYNACEIGLETTQEFIKPFCVIVRHKAEGCVNSLVKDAMDQLGLDLPEEPATPVLDEGDEFLKNLMKGEEPE